MIQPNTIIQGDCLEVMKGMPDKSVDFCFADPPYGINKAEWDEKYPDGFERELLRISKKGIAVTPGQENIGICINNLGDEYKGMLSAWNMNGMTYNKIGFGNWIPVVLGGDITRGQDFFKFKITSDKPNHPSPKPIEFMRRIVNRFTKEGDLILDPFMGSGTTCVAAKMLGRKYIGIELEQKYIDIAQQRLDGVNLDLFINTESK
jgi:site-specific DNA-methyltransferase (adenine-specific)